ncbi:MAG: EamA family transporter [Sporolactobacillus sp.]
MIYLALFVMTWLGAFAGFFLKLAANAGKGMIYLLKNIHFYIGAFLYLAAAIVNIYVLKFLPYSVVLPLTVFTYIWTMVLSHFMLKERITWRKVCGVLLIVFGACLVGMQVS